MLLIERKLFEKIYFQFNPQQSYINYKLQSNNKFQYIIILSRTTVSIESKFNRLTDNVYNQ